MTLISQFTSDLLIKQNNTNSSKWTTGRTIRCKLLLNTSSLEIYKNIWRYLSKQIPFGFKPNIRRLLCVLTSSGHLYVKVNGITDSQTPRITTTTANVIVCLLWFIMCQLSIVPGVFQERIFHYWTTSYISPLYSPKVTLHSRLLLPWTFPDVGNVVFYGGTYSTEYNTYILNVFMFRDILLRFLLFLFACINL